MSYPYLFIFLIISCSSFTAISPSNPTHESVQDLEHEETRFLVRLESLDRELAELKERTTLLEQLAMKKTPPLEEVPLQKIKESEKENIQKTSLLVKNGTREEFLLALKPGLDFYEEGKWGKAHLAFSSLDKEYDLSVSKGDLLYWTGMCWFQLKDHETAGSLFQKLLTEFPENPQTPSALFYFAQSELALGLSERGNKRLSDLIQRFPDSESAKEARQLVSKLDAQL